MQWVDHHSLRGGRKDLDWNSIFDRNALTKLFLSSRHGCYNFQHLIFLSYYEIHILSHLILILFHKSIILQQLSRIQYGCQEFNLLVMGKGWDEFFVLENDLT